MTQPAAESRAGIAAGVSAYTIWGLFPLYLKALTDVPASEMLAHRVMWSATLLSVLGLVAGRGRVLRGLSRKTWMMLVGSSLCIGMNWLLFMWAVLNAHTIDASLGYFILPLISVLFGTALLGERLSPAQWGAVGLAAAGVLAITVERGALPLLSLVLALSFSLYGLIRNRTPIDPLSGLLVETLVLLPVAGFWLLRHGAAFGVSGKTDALLIGLAVITSIPLMLFGWSARRLRLTTIGLLQYISPSLTFLLAIFLYREPLSTAQLAAFALIWTGLALYVADGWRRARAVSEPVEAR